MTRVLVEMGAVTPAQVVRVARGGDGVELSAAALDAIGAGRAVVDALAGDVEPHYGISTGFGRWPPAHPGTARPAQRSLIRSHAAGSGPHVEREVVRGMMLLRLSTWHRPPGSVRRRRGVRRVLDAGSPVVHEYGSLGCSGDLARCLAVALR
jgi:histidine ammonia-lyase